MMNVTQEKTGRYTIRIDGYTRFCLSAIMVLLAVLIVGMWAEGPISGVPDAAGAVAGRSQSGSTTGLLDARAQRVAMLTAAQETNKNLKKIVNLLKSGNIRVSIVGEGKKKKVVNNVRKTSRN